MRGLISVAFAAALLTGPAAAQQRQQPIVPEAVVLSEAVRRAIDAPWLSVEERRQLRVFHGLWDDPDLDTPALQAQAALNAWNFDHPALRDPAAPVEMRAEALRLQGKCREAIDLLKAVTSSRAARITAEALEDLGRLEEANRAIDATVQRLRRVKLDDAAELTEAVRALIVRSRLEGQPARDYQTMMDLLARAHQDLDRLYWPALLAEAELLLDKDNPPEAIQALHEVLALNPRCADAWAALGRVALEQFDFASATLAADTLRRIHPAHPLADLLDAESRLIQDDPEMARSILGELSRRWPALRPARALMAAAAARGYDDPATAETLRAYEELSPGSARAYYAAGRHLALDRQYPAAATMLEQAVQRQPAWPAPQIELGLLEMQSGRDTNALRALQGVVKLDPFNKRAVNCLHLLEQLASYAQIESEHFVFRYQPGLDEIAAVMMPPVLEKIHALVAGRFQHEPDRKTVIELLPNHASFGVRITGMPWIHTVAACTGPVIALEAPREGPPSQHLGTFDWPRVLQHEYTHTITLSQTRNRIPHWLTEAAAVSMEPGPRDYDRCMLLADAYRSQSLFSLDQINWAFIRPRKPTDRALAYAQGHWMVEYMNERFGDSALVRLINRYDDGVREEKAMSEALGIAREQFFADFLAWAGLQVQSWGLDPTPSMIELTDELRAADSDLAKFMEASQQARLDVLVKSMTNRIGQPASRRDEPLTGDKWPALVRPPVEIGDETLARWMTDHPAQPDVLELVIRRRLEEPNADDAGEQQQTIALLERYGKLRPVDPFPAKKLAQIYLARGDVASAVPHLERLDELEQKSPVYAVQLAHAYRAAGRPDDSMDKATRAVQINPYHAANRELAASIAIEAGHLDAARQHIYALKLLEPDRPQHEKRLERIEQIIRAKPAVDR